MSDAETIATAAVEFTTALHKLRASRSARGDCACDNGRDDRCRPWRKSGTFGAAEVAEWCDGCCGWLAAERQVQIDLRARNAALRRLERLTR